MIEIHYIKFIIRYVYVSAHMWRPEVNVGCCPQLYCLRPGLSPNLELIDLVRLAGQWAPGSSCLCLSNDESKVSHLCI